MAQINPNEPTVFVIDDDEAVRDALMFLFSSVGMAVRTYVSAEDFLASDWSDRGGCLVVDIHLAGMSGLELIDRIRGEADLPIVVVTGDRNKTLKARALASGAIAFVQKPLANEMLLHIVREATGHSLGGDALKARIA